MTRDELQRWLAGHREAARVQHDLAAAGDPAAAVALSLSLFEAMRAAIPATEIEAQRAEGEAHVRAIWMRLRQAAAR
jgi:hypothetical protein